MPGDAFLIGTQYAVPDYELQAQTNPSFLHPAGIRVQLGRTPNGSAACIAESDQRDARIRRLLVDNLHAEPNPESPSEATLELWAFSRRVREAHRQAAEDVVRTVRWMTNREIGGAAVRERQTAAWSDDGGAEWHRLPIGDPPLMDARWGPFR